MGAHLQKFSRQKKLIFSSVTVLQFSALESMKRSLSGCSFGWTGCDTEKTRTLVLDVLMQFCIGASGACLVSLKAFTPSLLQFASWFICGPHFAITLPLLNISRSQETGSQHWIFYNHTFFFFNRLGSGFHNFVFHGFLGGISEFFKVFKAEHEKRRPLGWTTVPSSGRIMLLQKPGLLQ